ncbi:MAG: 2-dehydro-3-deoxygalactonokinase [Alphaproteobacteria bacterium]|nr:2-dehydro-3-deoxygalactonokinase [Alphaproteobacteria bacterium]MBU2272262.1 2-dehydro-3-deoxygalactonokinase [Alphaproteobacteria bacterium]MBU2417956.1 2-dehydro-3-deoxygalactonokinase [Alphaproteobacteria bacterium]
MTEATALIGVDWGSTNLRVLRIAAGGAVLDRRADPRGAVGLAPGDFPGVLEAVAGDWLADGAPVLVCGMAGARQGWIEVPYCPCPAGVADLAAGLIQPEPAYPVAIVPGVAFSPDGVLTDVMRGEETQALGLAAKGLVVAPGTHSKWITLDDDRIVAVQTCMTGELFSALRKATMLGVGMGTPGVDTDAFRRGVGRGLEDRNLGAALFSVRVESLAGRLEPTGTADYLSGLLIGSEIAGQDPDRLRGPLTLIGDAALSARYSEALEMAGGRDVRLADVEQATAAGLWRIWEASQ